MFSMFCGSQRAITILDMEKRLPCCLKSRIRSGVEKNLGTAQEEDHRWCFRLVYQCDILRELILSANSDRPLASNDERLETNA